MTVPNGEPVSDSWRVVAVTDLLHELLAPTNMLNRTQVIAIDGRSAAGKSTLAAKLQAEIDNTSVVHTDDIAWGYSFFDWADLMVHNVLTPVRSRRRVAYRPPGWDTAHRPGIVELHADLDLLIVEGVGAGRRELTHWIDALIWVQSDFTQAETRGIARDIAAGVNGGGDGTVQFWNEYMTHELVFMADQQPWTRADAIAAGTPVLTCGPREVVVQGEKFSGPVGGDSRQ